MRRSVGLRRGGDRPAPGGGSGGERRLGPLDREGRHRDRRRRAAADGSIYAAGSQRQSISVAATLRKYTAAGTLRWTRSWLPTIEASTHGVGVAVGDDGTIYVLGRILGQCEGSGWFVRAYAPGGQLRWKYLTPGWACGIAERPTDIDVRGDLVVVSGSSFGCCSDPFHDGWVQAFHRRLAPWWRADVEPPSPSPGAWYDTAGGVGIGPSGNVFASGWAATKAIVDESSPTPGTPIVAKLRGNGARVWSRRADVSMPTPYLAVPIAVSADGVVIAAGIEGKGTAWGSSPTTGWLASYTVDGVQRWQRRFGGGPEVAVRPDGPRLQRRDALGRRIASRRRRPRDRRVRADVRGGRLAARQDADRPRRASDTSTRTTSARCPVARRRPRRPATPTAAPAAGSGGWPASGSATSRGSPSAARPRWVRPHPPASASGCRPSRPGTARTRRSGS